MTSALEAHQLSRRCSPTYRYISWPIFLLW